MRKKLQSHGTTAITYLLAFLFFFPILWLLTTGFKTESEAIVMPPSLLFQPIFDNFVTVWSAGAQGYMTNSIIVTLASTALSLLLGVPAAFALAMYQLKRANDILFWFISTKFLPIAGVIIPIYLIFQSINLLDTLTGLIILYAGMNTPLVVWMMRSFFKEVTYELIEAAQVDGATGIQTFFKIVFPLVRPGLVSTALLCMVFAWNEFFFSISLSYTNAGTLPVYMAGYMTQEGLFWAKMSAAATISILPVIILGWFTQKQLVRGLTMGAVKG
ncbi:carbohydrate ABC transporter permease [Evansella halocellulosilytica]|uniref:carbohydrate ABC transporter permease n=1 Tax=Evansella halocellulosilytica TaxID=2011013 RepID=UPI000BB686A6|nr:carbohydrate ABC transporter permease [Evansella halocellulosilytica]